MSELEDKIAGVLNDPEQMAQITRIAQSLMGGDNAGAGEDAPGASAPAASPLGELGALGIDGATLARITRALSAARADNNAQQALLNALHPFLSQKRQEKLARGVKIARLVRIAREALAGGEGGENA